MFDGWLVLIFVTTPYKNFRDWSNLERVHIADLKGCCHRNRHKKTNSQLIEAIKFQVTYKNVRDGKIHTKTMQAGPQNTLLLLHINITISIYDEDILGDYADNDGIAFDSYQTVDQIPKDTVLFFTSRNGPLFSIKRIE